MTKPQQRRRAERVSTRLKPGKLLSPEGKFLADCAITDRSGAGARVRVFGGVDLRPRMILFDETETVAWAAQLAWDEGSEAGLRFLSGSRPVPADIVSRISGRYYAVPD
ncbi:MULTISPECIES: hypothetical protein [unclassified Aureimonas]|uniref:hypothetical protein n=1 Tax=unclassified Aureimonas TaxID=2615206 RepID=UPI0006F95BE2|nr:MULTISPECIES: hypothetical protein [unclassified Aureimonas]KQT66098.1 hypothetical protein ASG62_20005 [Aureimonas sp. Leaf427]KQT81038.1 hypothetical protein ASG54_06245 [Aureimonas sp. Leaf460]